MAAGELGLAVALVILALLAFGGNDRTREGGARVRETPEHDPRKRSHDLETTPFDPRTVDGEEEGGDS